MSEFGSTLAVIMVVTLVWATAHAWIADGFSSSIFTIMWIASLAMVLLFWTMIHSDELLISAKRWIAHRHGIKYAQTAEFWHSLNGAIH